jgi:hypothetical protein
MAHLWDERNDERLKLNDKPGSEMPASRDFLTQQ